MGLFGSQPPLQFQILLLLFLFVVYCGYGISLTAATTDDKNMSTLSVSYRRTKTGGINDDNIPLNPSVVGDSSTQCSFLTKCGAGETCCCTNSLFLVCLKWRCCGIDSAVCCKDNSFCCPQDYPVCDNQKKQCFKKAVLQDARNATMLKGIEGGGSKGSSAKFGGWRSLMQGAWNIM